MDKLVNLKNWKFSYKRMISLLGAQVSINGRKKYFSKELEHDFEGPYQIIIDGSVFVPRDQEDKILSILKNETRQYYFRLLEKTKKQCNRLYRTVKNNINNTDLDKALRNCFKELEKVSPFFWLPWYIAEHNLTLRQVDIEPDRLNKLLAYDIKKDFIALERQSLANIAIKRNRKEYDRLIKSHHLKYSWLNQGYLSVDEGLQISYFKNRVKEIKDPLKSLKEYRQEQRQQKIEFNQLILKLDSKIRSKIILTREYNYILNWSVERIFQSCFLFNQILFKAAKIIKIDFSEIKYLTSDEIINLKKIDKNILAERKQGYGYAYTKDHHDLFIGKSYSNFKKIIFKIIEIEDKDEIKEIKGQSTYKGIIKGRVAIVNNTRDLIKVGQGDIIVCSMTAPGFIPALNKAAGWVTDEGGLLSHAAIISREFKKPCVVGTKIATQILKDGDMVEVDAEKGEVRRIK